jgi:hypothetical protein
MKKSMIYLLALILLLSCLTGCSEAMGEIAGNVTEVAKAELEAQVKAAFEKYKVEVIEFKPILGKLNGSDGTIQFFCAALVQSDSEAVPQDVADTLSKLFHDAGLTVQSGTKIESGYLEHKELSYKFSGFQDGKTYYTVWCYTDKIPSLSDLKDAIPATTSSGVG